MTSLAMSRATVFKQIFSFFIVPLVMAASLQRLGDVGVCDSIAYWAATQVFLNNGNPYDGALLFQVQQPVAPYRESAQFFLNPPWTLLPLLVLGKASFATFSLLILTLNISCSFFAISRLAKLFGPLQPRYVLIVGCFFPVLSSWFFGQLSFCLILGSVLTLEWAVENNKPWWKAFAALALFSIKPQALYLVFVAIFVTSLRTLSRTDLTKMGLCVSPVIVFLLYRNDLILNWIVSFQVSSNWATSSLPSWLCANFPSLNHPITLAGPSLVIALGGMAFFRKGITPYQLLWCFVISALTAPYAWIFDFAPFVIIVYLIMAISVAAPIRSPGILCSLYLMAVLCIPFEGIYSSHLQSYIIHPLVVTAVLFFNRHKVHQLIEKRTTLATD